ncbi:MAG TPA: ATP-binding protein [Gammaproteobacteria bacterium]|nr:ATP-binding protein [Gammaproteobacteria bacterium]
MLKELSLKNFTAFSRADFKFCEGLNVIVGENGTGKTHVLKLAHIFSNAWQDKLSTPGSTGKEELQDYLSERILNVFKPEKIGNLARSSASKETVISAKVMGLSHFVDREANVGETPFRHEDIHLYWQIKFSERSQKKIKLERFPSTGNQSIGVGHSVFLPSKEMISFFDGFLAIYKKRELPFDETFYDLALALSASKLKQKPELLINLMEELEQAIGGKVVLEGGRFYVINEKNKKREITLLAEGLRKLATILQLIENGSLETGGTLLWDEPESNLNPKLIKMVAELLFYLCRNGIQVVVATHSLFLLRELEILNGRTEFKTVPTRYFALSLSKSGVRVSQADLIDKVDPLVVLDESLQQSDRFIEMG